MCIITTVELDAEVWSIVSPHILTQHGPLLHTSETRLVRVASRVTYLQTNRAPRIHVHCCAERFSQRRLGKILAAGCWRLA